MNEFKEIITYVAYGIETIGVLVIVIGCAAGTARLLPQLKSRAISELSAPHSGAPFTPASVLDFVSN